MRIENDILYSITKDDLEADKSFIVPETVKKIAAKAFHKVPMMRSIFFHRGIEDVSIDAFNENSELSRTNVIPNEMIDANAFVKCKNLKHIDIDGDISFIPRYINKLIVSNKVANIEINWFDKIVMYQLSDENHLIEITKAQDKRFIVNYLNNNGSCIIDYNYIRQYDFNDIKDYTSEDEKDFKKAYKHVLSERFDLIYDWIRFIQENPKCRKLELPVESILLSLPNTKEVAASYYIYDKKWKGFNSKYLADVRSDLEIGVTKLCYAIGYFFGNIETHEYIEEFLKRNRTKIIDDNIGLLFHKINFRKEKLDLHFGQFIRNDWANICNAYTWDVEKSDYLEDVMKKIYDNFNEIKQYASQNKLEITFDMCKKYLSLRSLETRRGNEDLYKEVKKYHHDYGTLDYERMQDLYEQAQNPEVDANKLIFKTKDSDLNYVTYEWLDASDPLNFVLGNKVGSCARVGDVGEGILKASVLDTDARNLVFKDKKAKLIGKATAYFNEKKKYILFNTLYVVSNRTDMEKIEILNALKRAVNDQVKAQNKKEIKLERVSVGMNNNGVATQIQRSNMRIKHNQLLKNKVFVSPWIDLPYLGDANGPSGQAVLYSMPKEKIKKAS